MIHAISAAAFVGEFVAVVQAATLTDVCTTSYVQASLPPDGTFNGISIDPSSVVVHPVTNYSATGSVFYPNGTFDYCNVTFTYTHSGLGDTVELAYWLPTPANFLNRFLTIGGAAEAINTGTQNLPGGVLYGSVSGITDGGFGSFSTDYDVISLITNGTIDRQALYMFGYQGIHEMTIIGQEFTKLFFNMSDAKLYSYYQACSEGGREGWSQIQRFGGQFDGSIVGAPALRYGFQQVNHMYSGVVEKTLGYYPPSCEMEKIVNLTISACDPLDGKTDGVVARTDLCKLNFNLNSTIGTAYSCASSSGSFGKRQAGGGTTTPAQNGTILTQAVAVANKVIDGLLDSAGLRVYLSFQPAADISGDTSYDSDTGLWETTANTGGGVEWVARWLNLVESSTIENWDNVTYDTLKEWMLQGWQTYEDVLQTTWPDLTPYYSAGGKILHFHGESDNSIPTASSVRYFESVRSIMYPRLSYNDSISEMNDWYRLFLIPGAAHCATNDLQPNAPFPQTNLAVMIDWVENGVEPTTLNATVLQGEYEGETQDICGWPLRPYWNNGTMECQYDQASINSWLYNFDAIKMPVY
jgi:tannase